METDAPIGLSFRALHEDLPGDALRHVFAGYWPAYQKWMRRAPAMESAVAVDRFTAHMPELAPIFESLWEALGGGDDVARFLTQYCPPRLVRACSQLVLDVDDGPVLIRSYDHHPRLFDAVVLSTAWNGTGVVSLADCLWGALDGVNDRGLAVALAFGGRNVVGEGFGAPLVVRYLLETCGSVEEARDALQRVPVFMPYTFVAADADGDFVTAFLAPEEPAKLINRRASANHQDTAHWPAYARQTQSAERQERLESLLKGPAPLEDARGAFLSEPIWRGDYERGAGTLYVSEYRPAQHSVTLRWPGREERFRVDSPREDAFGVRLV